MSVCPCLANAYVSVIALSPDDIAIYCGYLEAAFGVCSAVGPVLATGVYQYNARAPFWFSVALALLCGLLVLCTLCGEQKRLLKDKDQFQLKFEASSPLAINNTDGHAQVSTTERTLSGARVCLLSCLCIIEFFKASAFSVYGSFMILFMEDRTDCSLTM